MGPAGIFGTLSILRMSLLSLSSLLAPDRVRVGLDLDTKEEVVDALIALAATSDAVRDGDQLREDVWDRERRMSTGVGQGLALPHARTAAVSETVAAFATLARPIDYGALDGAPVRLALLLAGPEGDRGRHVRILSRVSLVMSDDGVRQRLAEAETADAVLQEIREAEDRVL